MKIFKEHQQIFANFGINRPSPFVEFKYINVRNSVCIVMMVFQVFCLGWLFFNSKSPLEYSKSWTFFSASFTILYMYSVLIWKAPAIYGFIEHIEKLIEKRAEQPHLKVAYDNLSRKIDKFIKILHILFTEVACISCMLPILVYMSIIHFTRGLEDDDYFLPFPMWLPFNWKTFPIGYSAGIFCQFLAVFIVLKVAGILTLFLLECCVILIEFARDIKQEFITLNENWKVNQNRLELTEKLTEIIYFDYNARLCVSEMTKFCRLILLANFIWSSLVICASFMRLQNELSNDSMDIDVIVSAICTLYSFGLAFMICECGERIESQFNEMNDVICESDWYTFPHNIQRMMPIILQCTQHPVEILAYGDIPCSRPTFKRIVNGGYTYFTVFREI